MASKRRAEKLSYIGGITLRISIRRPVWRDCEHLADMLCSDETLRKDLGFQGEDGPTPESFRSRLDEWCEKHHAVSYAIVLDSDRAVGLISLSHINNNTRSAGIGYWMSSGHRRHGYCSDAFGLVVQEAKQRDLRRLRASIEAGNTPSRRIWEKCGGRALHKPQDKKIEYEILLDH